MHRIALIVLLMASMLACAGCGPGYTDDGPRAAGSAISAKRLWRVSGELANAQAATDGDTGTCAVSGPTYTNATLMLDLGKPSVFNMLVLDQAGDPAGYPRRLAVQTSMDGRNFSQVATVPGNRRYTIISLIAPTLARYVRLQVLHQGERPWNIAEIYIQ